MIKGIIFDMDGVLIEAKELHYEALNQALGAYGYRITRLEHLSKYDGRPTRKKLKMLTEEKNLPEGMHDAIWKLKQYLTYYIIEKEIKKEEHIIKMLAKLKSEGYKLACCSNSIRRTCHKFLEVAGIHHFFDVIYSNQDVKNPKPNPEMFLKSMEDMGLTREETVIVEDSPVGLQAAYNSGAHVCPVKNTKDTTYGKIKRFINEVDK